MRARCRVGAAREAVDQYAGLVSSCVLPYPVPVARQHLAVPPDRITPQNLRLDAGDVVVIDRESGAGFAQQLRRDVAGVAQREDRLVGGQVVENLARVYPLAARGMDQHEGVGSQHPRERLVVRNLSGDVHDGGQVLRNAHVPMVADQFDPALLRPQRPFVQQLRHGAKPVVGGDRPIEMSDERHREAGLERGVVHLVEFVAVHDPQEAVVAADAAKTLDDGVGDRRYEVRRAENPPLVGHDAALDVARRERKLRHLVAHVGHPPECVAFPAQSEGDHVGRQRHVGAQNDVEPALCEEPHGFAEGSVPPREFHVGRGAHHQRVELAPEPGSCAPGRPETGEFRLRKEGRGDVADLAAVPRGDLVALALREHGHRVARLAEIAGERLDAVRGDAVFRMEAGAYDEDSHVRSCGAFCPRDTSSRNCIVSRSSG